MCNRATFDLGLVAKRVAWGLATPALLPVLVPLAVLDRVYPLRLPAPFDGPPKVDRRLSDGVK